MFNEAEKSLGLHSDVPLGSSLMHAEYIVGSSNKSLEELQALAARLTRQYQSEINSEVEFIFSGTMFYECATGEYGEEQIETCVGSLKGFNVGNRPLESEPIIVARFEPNKECDFGANEVFLWLTDDCSHSYRTVGDYEFRASYLSQTLESKELRLKWAEFCEEQPDLQSLLQEANLLLMQGSAVQAMAEDVRAIEASLDSSELLMVGDEISVTAANVAIAHNTGTFDDKAQKCITHQLNEGIFNGSFEGLTMADIDLPNDVGRLVMVLGLEDGTNALIGCGQILDIVSSSADIRRK